MKTLMCSLLVPILLATPAWSSESSFRLEWIEEVPAADAGELYDRALTWIADKRSVDGSTTFHDRDLKRINGLAALSIPRGKSFLSSEDKYRVDYSIEVKDGRYRFKIREIYFVYADRPNILVLTGNSKKVLNRVSEHMEEHLRS